MVKHVAMYLRISQEKKEQEDTLDNHKRILIDHCEKNKWTYEIFGEVLSGGVSDLGKRPQLQRLLSELDRFDGVLVVELSRLARNGLISETVLQACVDYDKPIYTPYQVYDLANNENDVLIYRFGSLISAQEHKKIGKRSKDNKIIMARQGMWVSGAIPFGYTRDDSTKRLIPKQEEGAAVKRIFELHAQGMGLTAICDRMNAEGFVPQRSKYWNTMTVRKILGNKVYMGTVVFNDLKRVKRGTKFVNEVQEVIEVPNAHPSIIEPHEFHLATIDRQERGSRHKPSNKIKTLLKDILYCGRCGKKSRFNLDNGKIVIRSCTNRIDGVKCDNSGMLAEYVEEDIVKHLKNYEEALHEELQSLEGEDVSHVKEALRIRLEHVSRELDQNEKRQANLLDLALDGLYTREELQTKKNELTEQKETLLRTQEEVKQELSNIQVESITEQIKGIMNLLENFNDLDVDRANHVLRKVIKRVEYTRVIPDDIKALSPVNPTRRYYPYEITIEYYK